ncbi:MAG TPA: hypothetical protein VHZ29_08645 [Rhizomicrobium sp.]|nr:hypothetical protein [Rhizomicrobium sp.]
MLRQMPWERAPRKIVALRSSLDVRDASAFEGLPRPSGILRHGRRGSVAEKREDARRAAVAEAELAEIETEETKLRERRQKLQKTFKVHAAK